MQVYLINSHGGYHKLDDFHIGDNSISSEAGGTNGYDTCSIQWKNQYYILGGRTDTVSMLNRNRLEHKGKLIFKGKGESGLLSKAL